jgi:tRNA-dihydrouridine synthase
VVAVTVDGPAPSNWETLVRLRRTDTRQCDGCHGRTFREYVARKPNFDGIDLSGVTGLNAQNLTWDSIKRLRDTVKMKIVLKGILAPQDAIFAADCGIDGVIVSNHSGRMVDSGRATIEVLPEIIEAVGDRMPVLVDSGFRRGTDIIKALAMGAKAVCIGRPYLWGLGAFGQPGVERVLELLRTETRAAMQQVGRRQSSISRPPWCREPERKAGVERLPAPARGGKPASGRTCHLETVAGLRGTDGSNPCTVQVAIDWPAL